MSRSCETAGIKNAINGEIPAAKDSKRDAKPRGHVFRRFAQERSLPTKVEVLRRGGDGLSTIALLQLPAANGISHLNRESVSASRICMATRPTCL